MVVYGFTVLLDPIAAETGWSYTHLSLASSIRGTESALLAPFIGAMADRWGPKRLVLCGSIIVGLGLFLLGRVSTLAMFYIAFATIAVGSTGIISAVLFVPIVHWFKKGVGKAIAIVSACAGLSGLMVPLLTRLVDAYGWRTIVPMLACMWVLGIPLSFVFRHRPEPYGYLPDEVDETSMHNLGSSDPSHCGIGIRQALKSRRFWQIAFAFMLPMMASGAVIIHIMPYLSSVGITRPTASLIVMAIPTLSVATRLGFGWVADYLEAKYLVSIAFGLLAMGMLAFACLGSSHWLFVPFLIAFSAGYGGMYVLKPILIRGQFGTRAFGTILGATDSAMVIGTILGAPLAGWVFDTKGMYQPIWFIFTGDLFLALLLIITIPSARRELLPGRGVKSLHKRTMR